MTQKQKCTLGSFLAENLGAKAELINPPKELNQQVEAKGGVVLYSYQVALKGVDDPFLRIEDEIKEFPHFQGHIIKNNFFIHDTSDLRESVFGAIGNDEDNPVFQVIVHELKDAKDILVHLIVP